MTTQKPSAEAVMLVDGHRRENVQYGMCYVTNTVFSEDKARRQASEDSLLAYISRIEAENERLKVVETPELVEIALRAFCEPEGGGTPWDELLEVGIVTTHPTSKFLMRKSMAAALRALSEHQKGGENGK